MAPKYPEQPDLSAIEPRYTLQEAAKRFFPGGIPTKKSLLREKRRGRLRVEQIAGKYFTTESAIRDMCAACEVPLAKEVASCPDPESRPASICGEHENAGQRSTSSSMDRKKLAREQALLSLNALRGRSELTLPKGTSRQVLRLNRGSSSSTR